MIMADRVEKMPKEPAMASAAPRNRLLRCGPSGGFIREASVC